jgi:hypothetical protein
MQGKTGTRSSELVPMTQFIEPVPLKHIPAMLELEIRLLHDLADPGGCQYFPDLVCYDERSAQRILQDAIGRAWGLKGYEE